MYFLWLFATAFLIISIFSANWPIKLYHYLLLQRLGQELKTEPKKHGLLLSNVYSEIITNYRGKNIKIRFIENSIDSIKAYSGLEIRIKETAGLVMEIYRVRLNKREWGDFRRFTSGDGQIDAEWLILTTAPEGAKEMWDRIRLADLLKTTPQLDQILINQEEVIIQLKRYPSTQSVLNIIDRIVSCFP